MDDKRAQTELSFGNEKLYPATFLVGMLTSLNEHYGNVVGYLRTKGCDFGHRGPAGSL
jgi:hypothetical protein